MRIKKLEKLNDFISAVDKAKGAVFLDSPMGDRFNLRSYFSQYLALERLMAEQDGVLELICVIKDDEKLFEEFRLK